MPLSTTLIYYRDVANTKLERDTHTVHSFLTAALVYVDEKLFINMYKKTFLQDKMGWNSCMNRNFILASVLPKINSAS